MTVQNSELEQNYFCNAGRDCCPWGYSLASVNSDFTTFRNNVVRESHGEAIGDMLPNDTTIEDNVVWDGYTVGIYLDHSKRSTVRRNIVYATNNTDFYRNGRPSPGIVANNEADLGGTNFGDGELIVDNFVYNTGVAFAV